MRRREPVAPQTTRYASAPGRCWTPSSRHVRTKELAHVRRSTWEASDGPLRGGDELKTTRTWGLLVCACAALAGAGVAGAGIDVGVTEDAGKAGNGAALFSTLGDVGLKVTRMSINWYPAA